MSGSGDELVDLEPVVTAASWYPDAFLAGWLSPQDQEAMATCLGLSRLRMQRLLLCRPPRGAAEVAQIARLVGVSPVALAATLKAHGITEG